MVEGGTFPFTGGRRGPRPPEAVIVCLGLGARTLGGVEDKEMYPIRGQTVLLRAPWVRFGRTMSEDAEEIWTYVIPRRRGDVSIPKVLKVAFHIYISLGYSRWNEGC